MRTNNPVVLESSVWQPWPGLAEDSRAADPMVQTVARGGGLSLIIMKTTSYLQSVILESSVKSCKS